MISLDINEEFTYWTKMGRILISYEIKSATDFFYDHFYNRNQH